jgi:protein-disulfide isomerase
MDHRTSFLRRAADLATVLVALCAIVATARVLGAKPATAPAVSNTPSKFAEWPALVAGGRREGLSSARVVIVEFIDFECPYCATFAGALRSVQSKYPRDIMTIYYHFPLPQHKQAFPAARASECAAKQGRFGSMHDKLFQSQDSLGVLSYREIARRAGVPDLGGFDVCLDTQEPDSGITKDFELGERLNVRATPTVIINGMRYPHAMDASRLEAIVKEVLSR